MIRNKDLQTGLPKDTFKAGDPHPTNKDYVFWSYPTQTDYEYWLTREKKQRQHRVQRKYKKHGRTHEQKARHLFNVAMRKRQLQHRTPESCKPALIKCEVFKRQVNERAERLGLKHRFHLDHIYSIYGKHWSGLNVPWNLQLLIEDENLSKGNKHRPDLVGIRFTPDGDPIL